MFEPRQNQPLPVHLTHIQFHSYGRDEYPEAERVTDAVDRRIVTRALQTVMRLLRASRGAQRLSTEVGCESNVRSRYRQLVAIGSIIASIIGAGPMRVHQIIIRLRLAPAIPDVLGYAIYIEHAVLNLFWNAVEAMEDDVSPGRRYLTLDTYLPGRGGGGSGA